MSNLILINPKNTLPWPAIAPFLSKQDLANCLRIAKLWYRNLNKPIIWSCLLNRDYPTIYQLRIGHSIASDKDFYRESSQSEKEHKMRKIQERIEVLSEYLQNIQASHLVEPRPQDPYQIAAVKELENLKKELNELNGKDLVPVQSVDARCLCVIL
ncbi:MAG TPA: hypothetical protein VLG44_04055 [Chlamydiales bacterium]|nr:hypothetical protein [Chlamydiales bacterium]